MSQVKFYSVIIAIEIYLQQRGNGVSASLGCQMALGGPKSLQVRSVAAESSGTRAPLQS